MSKLNEFFVDLNDYDGNFIKVSIKEYRLNRG
jgi:hypothetical protein